MAILVAAGYGWRRFGCWVVSCFVGAQFWTDIPPGKLFLGTWDTEYRISKSEVDDGGGL
jgi:hypothetical protein